MGDDNRLKFGRTLRLAPVAMTMMTTHKISDLDGRFLHREPLLWHKITVSSLNVHIYKVKNSERTVIWIFRTHCIDFDSKFMREVIFSAKLMSRYIGMNSIMVENKVQYTFFISNSIFDPLSLRFSKIIATWLATLEPLTENSYHLSGLKSDIFDNFACFLCIWH